MRVAVILENEKGAQVMGITSDEAIRIGKNGCYEFKFEGYRLRILVDQAAPALEPPSIPAIAWPDVDPLTGENGSVPEPL
jgi:hypothetical protein